MKFLQSYVSFSLAGALFLVGCNGQLNIVTAKNGLKKINSDAPPITIDDPIGDPSPVSATPDLAYADFNDSSYGTFYTDGAGADGDMDIINDPTGSDRGKVFRWIGTHSGGGGIDINRWITPEGAKSFPSHYFFSGDLYLPTNTAGLTNSSIQRKLLYFRTSWPSDLMAGLVFKLWGNKLAVEWVTSAEDQQIYDLATLSGGAWHRIEVEIQINSAWNISDGGFRLWVDGEQKYEKMKMRLFAPDSDPHEPLGYDTLGIGYQREGAAGESSVNEVRYWDNVGFSRQRIGG
jgi:hypothetical protein